MYPSRTGQSGQSEGQSNQDKLYYQHGYQECYWQPSNIPPHPPNFTGYPPPPPPPPSQDSEQNVYYSQTPYCYPPSYSTNAPPPQPLLMAGIALTTLLLCFLRIHRITHAK